MFTGANILKYETYRDKVIDREMERNTELYKVLSFKDKFKLNRINKAISKIKSYIEKDSSWEYLAGEFVYKNNFHYDANTQDITFFLNRIVRKGDMFINKHEDNHKEKFFVNKYNELLVRLAKLEEKKDTIYQAYKDFIFDKTIPFSYLSSKSKKQEEYLSSRNYISVLAENYVKEYGITGIKELIFTLNKLDIEDPDIIYSLLVKNNKNKNHKRDLLMWISTYSNPGKKFIERFYDEYIDIRENYDKPDLEEIKTQNLIKLQL